MKRRGQSSIGKWLAPGAIASFALLPQALIVAATPVIEGDAFAATNCVSLGSDRQLPGREQSSIIQLAAFWLVWPADAPRLRRPKAVLLF